MRVEFNEDFTQAFGKEEYFKSAYDFAHTVEKEYKQLIGSHCRPTNIDLCLCVKPLGINVGKLTKVIDMERGYYYTADIEEAKK